MFCQRKLSFSCLGLSEILSRAPNGQSPVLLYLARSRSLPYNNEFYYTDEIDENVNTENCDIDKQEQASEKTEKQQPIRG